MLQAPRTSCKIYIILFFSDIDSDGGRRMSTSTRRSFFKRRKGGRSSSRDSKELASYSDVASFYSDTETGPLVVSFPLHVAKDLKNCCFGWVLLFREVLYFSDLSRPALQMLGSKQLSYFIKYEALFV